MSLFESPTKKSHEKSRLQAYKLNIVGIFSFDGWKIFLSAKGALPECFICRIFPIVVYYFQQ